MTRNVLLLVIIALLLWNAVILCDIRQASYDTEPIQRNKGESPERSPKWTPGELTPKLPQWNL